MLSSPRPLSLSWTRGRQTRRLTIASEKEVAEEWTEIALQVGHLYFSRMARGRESLDPGIQEFLSFFSLVFFARVNFRITWLRLISRCEDSFYYFHQVIVYLISRWRLFSNISPKSFFSFSGVSQGRERENDRHIFFASSSAIRTLLVSRVLSRFVPFRRSALSSSSRRRTAVCAKIQIFLSFFRV